LKVKQSLFRFSLIGVGLVAMALLLGAGSVQAAPIAAGPMPGPNQQPGVDNKTCLACHGQPDQYITLPSGEPLYLTVDEGEFNQSVHGSQGYACVQCHTNLREYPHPPLSVASRRDLVLELYQACQRCHSGKYDATLDSVHQKALAAGNKEAAVCTDCHGAHNVQSPHIPLSAGAQMCERCHSEIYSQYKDSFHGSALIGDGNPDVPSCIDCHGVHNVQGPLSNESFHLSSPLICAECHADEELMSKYGISTDVFDTYVSDFHGTTVVLFESKIPGQETNKPVCVDCHGVHDIRQPDDPESHVAKQNILGTCQKCHPDATINFSDSWLGHYRPDPNTYPVVFFVDLFYRIFVPTVLGGMAVFVVTDAARRLINRRKEKSHG